MMAQRKALFTILGMQRDCDGEENRVELMTQGTVERQENGILLRYEESEATGMAGSRTQLTLGCGSVDMQREGEYGMKLHFERGKQFYSRYETPYGSMGLSVLSREVSHRFTAKNGKVKLDYILEFDNNVSYENQLEISVRIL